jgi:hypothetical protein
MTDTLDTDPGHYSGTARIFAIPTSGYVGGASNHAYDWVIDWGDGSAPEEVSGTSAEGSAGISHTYAAAGEYQISIEPNDDASMGWMDAFGFLNNIYGANVQANKNMFKSIDSPLTNKMRSENSTHKFAYMFYSSRNAVGIPAGLFDAIDTSSAVNLGAMFAGTFYRYAYANKASDATPDTDVNDIWGNANFAGKVTAANAGGGSGVFFQTFYQMPSLVGTAQTFIDDKLGGIVPDVDASTFYGTSVSDLASLAANWK